MQANFSCVALLCSVLARQKTEHRLDASVCVCVRVCALVGCGAGVKQLAAGMHNSMALLEDGTVMTWCVPSLRFPSLPPSSSSCCGGGCGCSEDRMSSDHCATSTSGAHRCSCRLAVRRACLLACCLLAATLLVAPRVQTHRGRGRGDYCQLGTGPPPRQDSHSVVPVKCYPMTADLPGARHIDSVRNLPIKLSAGTKNLAPDKTIN
jgi:hypothetical protein